MYSPELKGIISGNRIPFGPKPIEFEFERRAESERISKLMRESDGFSFTRLGDFDLALLLSDQRGGKSDNLFPDEKLVTGTKPAGSPGLTSKSISRLRVSLENADYLDRWECQWKDNQILDELSLQRKPGSTNNPNRETSFILPSWVEFEFKSFCSGRRILFCGAEAKILSALREEKECREIMSGYWPDDATCFFHEPRERGQNLEQNLDLIKNDLSELILKENIDTVFLSLGGGAKILCNELARELNINAVDFGAMLRAFTYSGSDGHRSSRSTHSVFLYRIPFFLQMKAVEKAMARLSPEVILAKAHAQLLLDLQNKEIGWSCHSRDFVFSGENREVFLKSLDNYRKNYGDLFRESTLTQRERRDFLHFCGSHKLTTEGRFFYVLFQVKTVLGTLLGNRN